MKREPGKPRRSSVDVEGDDELLARIKHLVDQRPSYGYRRVTALLNAGKPDAEHVNHKRVYRLMKANKLLLERFTGRPARTHDVLSGGLFEVAAAISVHVV